MASMNHDLDASEAKGVNGEMPNEGADAVTNGIPGNRRGQLRPASEAGSPRRGYW